ncbi:MAG: hypothetical protein EXS14_03880 [Planctomycetes bacterium]|nr:hypothetical protein [Planctomycetota bacterium]
MRHVLCTILFATSLWAQPAILGTVSVTGGAAAIDLPTLALAGITSPAAIGRLQNNTGFLANDLTIRIEPAPGCSGSAPRMHQLHVGTQKFEFNNAGVGEARVNIIALTHSSTVPFSISTLGVATASNVRISFVFSAAPPWTPEVDIAMPVVVDPNMPVATQVLPFQGDAGVMFWVENSGTGPVAALQGLDIAFDFYGQRNNVVHAAVLDEFSLLPIAGSEVLWHGNGVTLSGAPFLAPLERVAVVVLFECEPTRGLGITTTAR